jgi:predicted murein hydrolase (TIGR00659 family)
MQKYDPMLQALFWSALTIGLYQLSNLIHRRRSAWWTSPMLIAPCLLILVALLLHVSYRNYITGTHWLVTLFAPATVAFAIPIYEQKTLIRRYWPLLAVGVVVGSITAIGSSWMLSTCLGLSDGLRLSLLPRSISTPFAVVVSGEIGGTPSLTAMFVLVTGIFGAAIGECVLAWLPLRSALAGGVLFGMGAHAFGTAKAHQIDSELGSIAGLVMVFVGLLNVLAAPFLARSFH